MERPSTVALFHRVTDYRNSVNAPDHHALLDTSPLGPPPTDPTLLATHQLLAHELAIATDTRSQTRGIA